MRSFAALVAVQAGVTDELRAENAELKRWLRTRLCLARRLALHQLEAWGVLHGSEASGAAALLVGELVANAVTHGRVPGRDFEVAVKLLGRTLRIEASDTDIIHIWRKLGI